MAPTNGLRWLTSPHGLLLPDRGRQKTLALVSACPLIRKCMRLLGVQGPGPQPGRQHAQHGLPQLQGEEGCTASE